MYHECCNSAINPVRRIRYNDYYDEKDYNNKSLSLTDIQNIEGIPTAMKMEMVDHKERSSTIMETLEVTYTWNPPKDFFSERNLKK